MADPIESGFATLAVDAEIRDKALASLREWLSSDAFAPYQPQLRHLVEVKRWDFLLDSFYRTIPFGTGGRRGPVGIGTNRINTHTITTSVQGHVHYLRNRLGNGRLRVVVAFDCRIFKDLRRLYDPDLPNPLLGIRSLDFARLAAGVYAANGVEVVTVPGDDLLLSTPELSFAIRHLSACGGLNVSASHNHPDDNGAKFYTEYGGQPIAPYDEHMAEAVAAVDKVESVSFDEAVRRGLIRWWDAASHDAYLQVSLDRSIDPTARDASIVYSPLHGTGLHTVYEVLQRAGFNVKLVPSQAAADGEFPAVKYRIPNPEVPEAMEAATAQALEQGADAAMSSDPDADRIGLVATHGGSSHFLTGNDIGVLLAAYILEQRAATRTLPVHAFVVKTGVTTELLTEIAHANGVTMIGDLLVGFKYVAAVLEAMATKGRYGAVEGTPDDFLLAVEESHGILVTPALRDKDAAGAALLLAELIASLKRRGATVVDYLAEIYQRYGFFVTASYSLIMEGVVGLQRIEQVMAALRQRPPQELEGRRVTRVIDYWDEGAFGPIVSATDRSSRNVVTLVLERGFKLTARPSGTEPKLKIYVEGGGKDAGAPPAKIREQVGAANLALAEHLLSYLNIRLERPALMLSSLVSVENRIDFNERFLPELRKRLAAGEEVSESWVDDRLRAYGKDPRFLVAPGIATVLGEKDLEKHAAALRRLFPLPA